MKKNHIYALCVILTISLGLTSCLKNDDDSDVTLYDDMAITSFSLSAVNRTMHTTSSTGADSTYKMALASSIPIFNIDQYKQLIYNTTPLPTECDLKHVLANISSKNNGTILLKSMTSDSLFYYSNTDSIDFSSTREIQVRALDGSGYRSYKVTVNMRDVAEGSITWTETAAGSTDIPQTLYQGFALTAVGDNSFRLSKDNGSTWTEEPLGADEDTTLLPTSAIAWTTIPYSADENVYCEMLAGSIDNSTASVVWRKVVDQNPGADAPKWVNLPLEQSNTNYLPAMTQLSLVWFNNALYAFGTDGNIYKSINQGISWTVTTDITLPDGLSSSKIKAVTDTDGNLWLMDTDSGRIWKGSITE